MGVIEELAEIRAAEAKVKGKAEGEAKAKELIIKNLLADTEFSDDKIATLTGASVDLVKKLRSLNK